MPHKIHGPWKMFFLRREKTWRQFWLSIYSSNFRELKWEYVSGGRGRSFFGGTKNIHLNLESGKQLPKQLNTNFSYLERWKGSLSQKYLWHLLCPWQWWPFEKDANSARTSWSYLVFLTRCIDQKGGSSGHFLLAEFSIHRSAIDLFVAFQIFKTAKAQSFSPNKTDPGKNKTKIKEFFMVPPPSTPSTRFQWCFLPRKKDVDYL